MIAWPIAGLVARRRTAARDGRAGATVPRATLPRLACWIAGLAAAITVIDLAALVLMLSSLPLVCGVPPAIGALTVDPFLVAILAAAVVVFAVLAWLRRFWSLPGRVHYTLVALALVAIVWLMSAYNILGPHLG